MKPDTKAIRARAKKAVERIKSGHAPMRIPADPTDADLVLDLDLPALCSRIEALEAALRELGHGPWNPKHEQDDCSACKALEGK